MGYDLLGDCGGRKTQVFKGKQSYSSMALEV